VRLNRFLALAALLAAPLVQPEHLPAQSSIFGVRGLGLPGRPLTPRSRAMAGSLGLFDGESDVNPAAMANLTSVVADFVIVPSWRRWETPAGNSNIRETRFPLVFVGGPVPNTHLALGVSIGSYADRDFRLASTGTLQLRGAPVGYTDTLSSLGGISEVRFGAAYALSPHTSVGGAVYWITGSSRLQAMRHFSDTTFSAFVQSAELSYEGVGFSLGITQQIGSRVQLAAVVRSDTKAVVDKDSTRAYSVDLPYTFSAGALLRASNRLLITASGSYRTWSGANSDLLAQGGVGSQNTLELALGGELVRNARRPAVLPIRLGIRYADLPFPIVTGAHPREISVSAGTGTRFSKDRAGIDIALEQAWRNEGTAYKERAFSLIFGLSIRPYGSGRGP
jgi:hypothetical protein